jgi:hypothetical protein
MKRKPANDSQQADLVGLIWQPFTHPFRLHAGDVIRLNNRLCRVIRVTECAAVVIMNRPVREFKTLFDKPVCFRPRPAIVRIDSNSETPVLNRRPRKRQPL